MRTIKEVEAQVEKKLSEVLKELHVLPNSYSCRARIRGESRKKRQSAGFDKSWSPDRDSIEITFEPNLEQAHPSSQPMASAPISPEISEGPPKASQVSSQPTTNASPAAPSNPAPKSGSVTDPVSDLVKALARAESQPGFDFVSLKWFRDAALPSESLAWASADSIREVLRDAIDKRLILTSKVPNPKSPQFPVTAIRLNRLMPKVKAVLGIRDEGLPDFQPVLIRGEDLSATVLHERR